MRRTVKPKTPVKLLFKYDVDLINHIIYYVGVDETGRYYSVEEHEYNIGSAYSMYKDYCILDDYEVEGLRQKAKARGEHV